MIINDNQSAMQNESVIINVKDTCPMGNSMEIRNSPTCQFNRIAPSAESIGKT